MSYSVTVARVNESAHKSDREYFSGVTAVSTREDGTLDIKCEDGRSASFGPTTWGAYQVVRVASAAERLG